MPIPAASSQDLLQEISEGQEAQEMRTTRPQIAVGNGVWRKLLTQAEVVAPYVQVASIEGEPGSGKQTLARYLHARSPLAGLPFRRHGAREWLAARTATAPIEGFVYLDRVDLLSVAEQGSLLEAVRTSQDQPRGRAILVASSRTLARQWAGHGTHVSDLLFRLTAIRFSVPRLRDRREDIALLAHFLLEEARTRHQKSRISVGPGVLACVVQHNWPGNVRELDSVLESALLRAKDGMIRAEDLEIPSSDPTPTERVAPARTENLDLHTVIRRHVKHVLELNHGNKLRSSRQLGISRSTLYRILGNESVLGR